MAALRSTKKLVNDYWLDKYGKIDKNDADYTTLMDWAEDKAFNARRPLTMDMVKAQLAVKTTPSSVKTTPRSAKPFNATILKTSLAYMYPLFGKQDGRGTVKKDDKELYESMRSWVNTQVIVTHIAYMSTSSHIHHNISTHTCMHTQ